MLLEKQITMRYYRINSYRPIVYIRGYEGTGV